MEEPIIVEGGDGVRDDANAFLRALRQAQDSEHTECTHQGDQEVVKTIQAEKDAK